MITLHRLGHPEAPFLLNSDLILTIEACPDTVVTLTTGARVVCEEAADHVLGMVLAWRQQIAAGVSRTGRRSALSIASNELI